MLVLSSLTVVIENFLVIEPIVTSVETVSPKLEEDFNLTLISSPVCTVAEFADFSMPLISKIPLLIDTCTLVFMP